ncbi:MAG TPA: cell wall hydrolase [Allosphingosinicella sp.]|nr:cell wall hydrolase [Allosphingosinicella sp.]
MFRFVRATAYAVTALVVASTAIYSRPSLAWETEAAPAVAQYLDHAAASLEISPTGDAPQVPAAAPPEASLTPAVTEHAAAAPAVAEAGEPEPQGQTLSALVSTYASNDVPDAEHECLAGAVYFESKGEPLQGQLAVAEVILNRASSGKFPTSICGVVKQKSQFSFVRGGRIPPISKGSAAWRKAVAIAHIAKKDLAEGGIGKAMFFHARYVSPRWRLTRVKSIGNHIFYR